MASAFWFAWTGASEPWSITVLREDEQVFAVEITHTEGDYASLKIDIRNPGSGLLGPSRQRWCWLSWDPGNGAPVPIPIFRGRLIGVPEQLQNEVVRLEFVARPDDFQSQKTALAAALKVAPYWDPVWLEDRVDDPDTVLEARPLLWHCDRTTLVLTASDIIDGEDGLFDIQEDEHFYEDLDVTYGETPLRRVSVTATVTWTQEAEGEVDLTDKVVEAFRLEGSPLPSPMISSLTGDGLLDSWPAPDASIGGGWTIGKSTAAVKATWIEQTYYTKTYEIADPIPEYTFDDTLGQWTLPSFANPSGAIKTWAVLFPVGALSINCSVGYKASRQRSEVVTFTLDADIQSLFTEPGADEEATLEFSSDTISDAIDPGDVAPLDDPRRNSYFKTARGAQSFEYLVALARTRILSRARAVIVKFVTTWQKAIDLSCRWNVRLFDRRLPGGSVIGKVTNLVYTWSEDGIAAEVTLGCTIGHGGIAAASVTGSPTYVAAGYFDPNMTQVWLGSTVVGPAGVTYLDFSNNFLVLDDDGIDFLNMVPSNILKPVVKAGVHLFTTGDTDKSTALENLADTTGLVVDDVYSIKGTNIQSNTQFLYTGSGAGILSRSSSGTAIGGSVELISSAINSNGVLVTNGPADQALIVDDAVNETFPDPVAALKAAPTRVCLDLVSLEAGPFKTDFAQIVSQLLVPKTIDLEAP